MTLPTNVRKIMCHAEFTCDRCGAPFLSMALAPCDGLTITGDAVRAGKGHCDDCEAAERVAERRAYNLSVAQRRWARNAAAKGRVTR